MVMRFVFIIMLFINFANASCIESRNTLSRVEKYGYIRIRSISIQTYKRGMYLCIYEY